jgi:tRNA (mo5U34)-methyltransferase
MLSFDSQKLHFLVDGAPVNLSPSEIAEMNESEWWHSIPFSPTVKPKAFCDPTQFISLYQLDRIDFTGKTVLDIGCWDGFQAFYAESRGAQRVVGADDCSQRHFGSRSREFAKKKLRSKVEFIDVNVYDLSPKYLGEFDIVMMFGVLYHLIHPMLGIEKACSICKGEFLFTSHFVDTPAVDLPICFLYPGGELEGDPTNWSGPNRAWIEHAFSIQGFRTEQILTYHVDRISLYAKRVSQARLHS